MNNRDELPPLIDVDTGRIAVRDEDRDRSPP
jgi:hypothetical protein